MDPHHHPDGCVRSHLPYWNGPRGKSSQEFVVSFTDSSRSCAPDGMFPSKSSALSSRSWVGSLVMHTRADSLRETFTPPSLLP
jgi:hypothetical protein